MPMIGRLKNWVETSVSQPGSARYEAWSWTPRHGRLLLEQRWRERSEGRPSEVTAVWSAWWSGAKALRLRTRERGSFLADRVIVKPGNPSAAVHDRRSGVSRGAPAQPQGDAPVGHGAYRLTFPASLTVPRRFVHVFSRVNRV